MSYANNKGADQPAHPRSLISAFVVRCLASVMSLASVTKISSLLLASVAEQASLSLTWSETPEDTFSHDGAHIIKCKKTSLFISFPCIFSALSLILRCFESVSGYCFALPEETHNAFLPRHPVQLIFNIHSESVFLLQRLPF